MIVDDGGLASGLDSAVTSGVYTLPTAMGVSDAEPLSHCESRSLLASCLLSNSHPALMGWLLDMPTHGLLVQEQLSGFLELP